MSNRDKGEILLLILAFVFITNALLIHNLIVIVGSLIFGIPQIISPFIAIPVTFFLRSYFFDLLQKNNINEEFFRNDR